jgi:tryptophan halogenase
MNTIKSIAIVGGGSSAWLSAAYLSYNLPEVEITVIDKEIGNPIGVGEATLSGFVEFMNSCGLMFDEYFNEIDMTFKLGILFPNWVDKGHEIWHPFHLNSGLENSNITLVDVWSKNQEYEFKTHGTCLYDTAMKNKVDISEQGFYAYHIDCGKLTAFIQKKLQGRVNFIKSEVVKVLRTEETIFALELANGNRVSKNLYIDCSGFNNILKYKADRVDLSDKLFCNTAVVGHIPYIDKPSELKPYVISEAVDHGWIWSIPVQSRIGSGLVFNRNITSPEEAKDYFVNYWDNRISQDQLKILTWDPFYTRNFWEGNVVSIGLSSAFIEPLESTGLGFTQNQIVSLHDRIKDLTYTERDVQIYNLDLEDKFLECVNFVNMHYSKTNRTEPFWKYVKEHYTPTDRLITVEKLLKKSPMLLRHTKRDQVFSGSNWTCWMAQMGYEVGESKLAISKEVALEILSHYVNNIERFRYDSCRSHYTEIQRLNNFSK